MKRHNYNMVNIGLLELGKFQGSLTTLIPSSFYCVHQHLASITEVVFSKLLVDMSQLLGLQLQSQYTINSHPPLLSSGYWPE